MVNDNYDYETVTRTGRDVVNATLKLLSWIARVGVPVQTSGRPSAIEEAKGGLLIINDPQKMWDHKVGCLACVYARARVRARIVGSESESALLSTSWGVTIVACLAAVILTHYTPTTTTGPAKARIQQVRAHGPPH